MVCVFVHDIKDEDAENENEKTPLTPTDSLVAVMAHQIRSFGSLQSGHQCLDTLHPHTALGEADIQLHRATHLVTQSSLWNRGQTYRLWMNPKLPSKVGLIRERRESASQAVIRLLQRHDTETSDVIRPLQFVRRTRPKCSRSYADFAQFLDHMGEDVLDRP